MMNHLLLQQSKAGWIAAVLWYLSVLIHTMCCLDTFQNSAVVGLIDKVTCGSQAVEECVSATKMCGAPHGIMKFFP